MQSERAMSAGEWIAANEAAEAAKGEILGGVVQKNIDELAELRKEQKLFREEQANTIHRENVRVYRNVQASMIAELEKQTALLQEEIGSLKEEVSALRQKVSEDKAVKVHSPLLLAAFLLSFGTFIIEILDFTGVLSWLIKLGNSVFFGI